MVSQQLKSQGKSHLVGQSVSRVKSQAFFKTFFRHEGTSPDRHAAPTTRVGQRPRYRPARILPGRGAAAGSFLLKTRRARRTGSPASRWILGVWGCDFFSHMLSQGPGHVTARQH